tara:strand:- start:130 stop:249 length:120 start_codon:yes stop_codon:yes gene_type:complete
MTYLITFLFGVGITYLTVTYTTWIEKKWDRESIKGELEL